MALGITATMAGTIVGAYGFVQLIIRIPVGVTADMLRNHKLFMAIGMMTLVISGIMMRTFSSETAFLLARALAGVAASTWVAFTVYFMNANIGSDAGRITGTIMICNNLGVLSAYIAGGILVDRVTINGLFIISAVAAGIGFIMILCLKRGDKDAYHDPMNMQKIASVIKDKKLWNSSLLAALLQVISFATAMSFTSNYAKSLGAGGFEIGICSAAFTGASLLASIIISSGAMYKIPEKFRISLSFVLVAVYCVMIPFCKSMIAIYIAQAIGGFGRNAAITLLMASAVGHVDAEKKSTAMGIFQSVYSLGMTIGPVIMGKFIDQFGGYTVPFSVMAFFAICGFIWAICTFGRRQKEEK